jgi:hypothetical protein
VFAFALTIVSARVGVLATLIAVLPPPPFSLFSGFTYFLIGPAHWIYGVRAARRRRVLELRDAGTGEPAVSV